MTFPKPPESHRWRKAAHPKNQNPHELDEPLNQDDGQYEENIEEEIEEDFDDINILDALATLARELDEAVLEVDDDAEEDKPALYIPKN